MEYVATPAYLSTASSTFEAEFKARLHWSAEADAATRVASQVGGARQVVTIFEYIN